jgi:hypothetical protein
MQNKAKAPKKANPPATRINTSTKPKKGRPKATF